MSVTKKRERIVAGNSVHANRTGEAEAGGLGV
jgi:hypothetical protein